MVEPELEAAEVGTCVRALGTLLEVDGKDAAAEEETWQMQEDAAIQLAGMEACVVGNVKVAVVVENEG